MGSSTENVKIVISAKDKATSILKNLRGSILGLSAGFAALKVAKEVFVESIKAAAKYEATLQSLKSVVAATGRDYNEVMTEMQKHTGGLASEASIAEGFLKGMTTALNPTQISKMTQAVKDASIAMGEDFNTQLPLIIKAVKQLNPAILDNIGVTVRLDRVNKRITEGYYGLNTAITEATQQNAIFQEIMRQTQQFRGQEAAYLETTQGKAERLSVAYKDLQREMGDFLLAGFGDSLRDSMSGLIEATRVGKSVLKFFSSDIVQMTPETKALKGEMNGLKNEIKHLEDTHGSVEEIKKLKEELRGLKQAAIDSANELVNFAATSDAVKRFNELSRETAEAVKNGIEVDAEAIANLSYDLKQLPVAASDATNQLIRGLDQYSLGFTSVRDTAKLTNDDIAAIVTASDAHLTAIRGTGNLERLENEWLMTEQIAATNADMHEQINADYGRFLKNHLKKGKQFTKGGLTQIDLLRIAWQKAERDKALATRRFTEDAGAMFGQFTSSAVAAFSSTKRQADQIWKDMAAAFMNFFIKKALSFVLPGGPFMTGLLGALHIFDVPANDRMAMQMGRDYASFFGQGANEVMSGFGGRFASSLGGGALLAAPGGSPAPASTVININITGGVEESTLREKLLPVLEEATSRNFTNVMFDPQVFTTEAAVELA